jgi:hypothetical protein
MWALLSQVGLDIDPRPLFLLYLALLYAGVAIILWVVMLVLSGGRGPRLPRVGRLPPFVVRLLVAVAAVSWVVCLCAYAAAGSRSEVFRTALPCAVAFTVAAVSVRGNGRPGRPSEPRDLGPTSPTP